MISAQRFTTQKTRPMTFNYLLCTPDDMQADERLPLIVFLHGAGERGDDHALLTVHGPAKRYDKNFPVRAILICPQCAADDVWYTQVHELKELIEYTIHTQPVDPDRVSLTGISMGGFGTWALAMAYPTLFSCAAPICGGGMAWNAGQLKDLPIRAFHGDCDTTVEPQYSLQMVQAVNRAGGHATLTLYPGVEHDSWTYTYEQTDLIEWLVAQKRKG